MFELDPQFHTPGWAEKRLKELEEERSTRFEYEDKGKFEEMQRAVNNILAKHSEFPTITIESDLGGVKYTGVLYPSGYDWEKAFDARFYEGLYGCAESTGEYYDASSDVKAFIRDLLKGVTHG